jgi:hypothetical protein
VHLPSCVCIQEAQGQALCRSTRRRHASWLAVKVGVTPQGLSVLRLVSRNRRHQPSGVCGVCACIVSLSRMGCGVGEGRPAGTRGQRALVQGGGPNRRVVWSRGHHLQLRRSGTGTRVASTVRAALLDQARACGPLYGVGRRRRRRGSVASPSALLCDRWVTNALSGGVNAGCASPGSVRGPRGAVRRSRRLRFPSRFACETGSRAGCADCPSITLAVCLHILCDVGARHVWIRDGDYACGGQWRDTKHCQPWACLLQAPRVAAVF